MVKQVGSRKNHMFGDVKQTDKWAEVVEHKQLSLSKPTVEGLEGM